MSGHKIGWFLKILFSYLLLTGILIACVGLPVIQNIRSLFLHFLRVLQRRVQRIPPPAIRKRIRRYV